MNRYIVKYMLDYGIFETGLCVRAVEAENEAEAHRMVVSMGNERIKRHNAKMDYVPYVSGAWVYDVTRM
jgi:hypothetical protein